MALLNPDSNPPVNTPPEDGKEGAAPPAEGKQGAPDQTPPGKQTEGTQSWRDALPSEIKDEASLQHIPDINTLAKSYVHAQKAIGADKIVLPNQYTSDSEKREIWHKLGLPRTTDEYAVSQPADGHFDKEFFNEYRTKCHELGVMPSAAQDIVKWFYDKSNTFKEQSTTEVQAKKDQELSALKSELGDNFNYEIERAQLALEEFSGDRWAQVKQKMIDTGWGDDPDLIRVFSKAAKLLKEDTIKGKAHAVMGKTPQQLQDEIRTVQSDPKHPYWDKNHPAHRHEVTEMNKRYEMLERVS